MAFFYIFILFFSINISLAQQTPREYGNEWIRFDLLSSSNPPMYFKMKIAKEGIYKLSSDDLKNIGVPRQQQGIITVDPRKFQVFHRGKEISVFVNGEADSIFHDLDNIVFYAKGNDGTMDSLVYDSSHFQPHKYYSLFSDTTAYFLTWNDKVNNKRIVDYDNAFYSGFTAEPYFLSEELKLFNSTYQNGNIDIYSNLDAPNNNYSEYVRGEGWLHQGIGFPGTGLGTVLADLSYDFTLFNKYQGIANGKLEILLYGYYNAPSVSNDHHIIVLVGNNTNPYLDSYFEGYSRKLYTIPIIGSDLSSTTKVSIIPQVVPDVTKDKIVVGYMKLHYPRTFSVAQATYFPFNLTDFTGTNTDYYIELSDYPSLTTTPYLFDVTNNVRIKVVKESVLKARVQRLSKEQRMILSHESNFLTPNIVRVNFENYFKNYDPTFNYNDYIILCTDSLKPSAEQYKNYRIKSPEKYKPVVITGSEVYNQFSYGEFTPYAIKRLAKYFLDKTDSTIRGLLILGRSYQFKDMRQGSADMFYSKTIAPMGQPPSDFLLVSGLDGWNRAPAIPIGRIPAKSNAEVRTYLDKVEGYESTSNIGIWSKNLFHISGGENIGSQIDFKNKIDSYGNIAKGKYFGAKVTSFYKGSSEPVQPIDLDSIHKIFKEGISLVTYFGHASTSVLEVDIGEACGDASKGDEGYKNKDKYPLMLLNGCYAGNVFDRTVTNSVGPRWLFCPDRGALGFLAHIDRGYPGPLHVYSSTFYKKACYENFGQTWGEVIQATIYEFDSLGGESASFISHSSQIMYQGDPVIKFKVPSKPDYQTFDKYLSLYTKDKDGNTIEASATSPFFYISIITENLGKAPDDSLCVSIFRYFPSGDTITYFQKFPPVFNSDTLLFKITSPNINTKGDNFFTVKLDYCNLQDEFNENNNVATLRFVIPSDGVNIISPYKYSIVNKAPFELIAQSNDLLKGFRNYQFEMDTSAGFMSTFLQKSGQITKDWLPSWQPDTNKMVISNGRLKDSVVYYWRVKIDVPLADGGYWENASFIYILNSPTGWSQSHFPQFSKVKLENVVMDTVNRSWSYLNTAKLLYVRSIGTNQTPDPCSPALDTRVVCKINNSPVTPAVSCCHNNGISFLVLDPSLEYYDDPLESKCNRDIYSFGLENEDAGSTTKYFIRIDSFLRRIPKGHYVIAWQYRAHFIQDVDDTVFNVYSDLGVRDSLKKIKDLYLLDNKMYGFIFFSVKGYPEKAIWIRGKTTSDTIELSKTIYGNWDRGTITSEKIGPAKKWKSLHFRYSSLEQPVSDKFSIDLIGIGKDRVETRIDNFSGITNKDTVFPINIPDSLRYPYLKLKAVTSDFAKATAPQMRRWQVIYDGVPEGTLIPPNSLTNDTLHEGQILNYNLAFKNISNIRFNDSVLVRYSFITNDRVEHIRAFRRYKPLDRDSLFFLPGQLNTMGYVGNNILQVEVNPNEDQPELYHFNNVMRYNFYVIPDDTPPILDIVVDGKHILNGDIISPDPLILIRLDDENKYLIQNDPSKFKILFQKPGEDAKTIPVDSSVIHFISGDSAKNMAQIEFDPGHLNDGIYWLRVRAQDRSDNKSGNREYAISFEVVNESSITYFFNYPNPFSTSTRFVFTLTGSKVPDQIKIQILTITGKIVREITKEELGTIFIGNNISDFVWNGTDEYGDKLANGVYFYRVILKDTEVDFNHRFTKSDKFFQKNFGKMYLMR